MKSHQLINADSGDDEYYTPSDIIEAARRAMGEIDLDPSSNEIANQRVRAGRFLTKQDDGLSVQWTGRVWMNHPFGKSTNQRWINKLCGDYESGAVTQAICITFAATSEKWFQPLLERPQCFFKCRTKYSAPSGKVFKSPPKGSVATYFGNDLAAFVREFSPLGVIKIAVR